MPPNRVPTPRGESCRVGLVRWAIVTAFACWGGGVMWFFSQSQRVAQSGSTIAHLAASASDLRAARKASDASPFVAAAADDDDDDGGGGAAGGSECPSMVYWRPKGKADARFRSPYNTQRADASGMPARARYATYEPDYGGFNNIRMTLETLVVFARVTGRAIVLPPKAPIYLLKDKPLDATLFLGHALPSQGGGAGEGGAGAGTDHAAKGPAHKLRSVVDFFSEGVAALAAAGLVEVISFDEFVERESGPGGLVYEASVRIAMQAGSGHASGGDVAAVAGAAKAKLLGWNSAAEHGLDGDGARKKVRSWLREAVCAPRPDSDGVLDGDGAPSAVDGASGRPLAAGSPAAAAAAVAARCPRWEPLKEAIVFGMPEEGGGGFSNGSSDEARRAAQRGNPKVDPAHGFTRAEFLTARRRAHIVDAAQAGEPWVHFMTDIHVPPARPLFSHWYTLFLFDDYATDLHAKRLVRDYIHYDEVRGYGRG